MIPHSLNPMGIDQNYPLMMFTEVDDGIWEVEGESTQVGIPSPENPIPIVSNYPKGVYKTNLPSVPYIRLYDDLRSTPLVKDKIIVNISTRQKILTKKVDKIIFDGNQIFTVFNSSFYTGTCVRGEYTNSNIKNQSNIVTTYSNPLVSKKYSGVSSADLNTTGVGIRNTNNAIAISLQRDWLNTVDWAGFQTWLQINNVEVIYELATPIQQEL